MFDFLEKASRIETNWTVRNNGLGRKGSGDWRCTAMMKRTRISRILSILAFLFLSHAMGGASPILFLSTQLTPLPEASKMRDVILKDFPQSVDFEPYDRAIFSQKVVELAASPGGSVILGGLQEDFLHLYQTGELASVEGISDRLSDRTFMPGIAARRKLGTDTNYFVPWMQATYLMAANKRSLQFLPKGADLKRLSYDDLL
jgi:multiple sugar transport system substrate-binding protein